MKCSGRQAIQAKVGNALTKHFLVDVKVAALKDHDDYKKLLNFCISPVAKRIAAEYNTNAQSATIIVL